jgi:hypothetical protein
MVIATLGIRCAGIVIRHFFRPRRQLRFTEEAFGYRPQLVRVSCRVRSVRRMGAGGKSRITCRTDLACCGCGYLLPKVVPKWDFVLMPRMLWAKLIPVSCATQFRRNPTRVKVYSRLVADCGPCDRVRAFTSILPLTLLRSLISGKALWAKS